MDEDTERLSREWFGVEAVKAYLEFIWLPSRGPQQVTQEDQGQDDADHPEGPEVDQEVDQEEVTLVECHGDLSNDQLLGLIERCTNATSQLGLFLGLLDAVLSSSGEDSSLNMASCGIGEMFGALISVLTEDSKGGQLEASFRDMLLSLLNGSPYCQDYPVLLVKVDLQHSRAAVENLASVAIADNLPLRRAALRSLLSSDDGSKALWSRLASIEAAQLVVQHLTDLHLNASSNQSYLSPVKDREIELARETLIPLKDREIELARETLIPLTGDANKIENQFHAVAKIQAKLTQYVSTIATEGTDGTGLLEEHALQQVLKSQGELHTNVLKLFTLRSVRSVGGGNAISKVLHTGFKAKGDKEGRRMVYKEDHWGGDAWLEIDNALYRANEEGSSLIHVSDPFPLFRYDEALGAGVLEKESTCWENKKLLEDKLHFRGNKEYIELKECLSVASVVSNTNVTEEVWLKVIEEKLKVAWESNVQAARLPSSTDGRTEAAKDASTKDRERFAIDGIRNLMMALFMVSVETQP